MHSRAKAEMRSEVIGRISSAAEELGQEGGVDNYVALQQAAPRARDPEVQSIFELRAVAELLEDLKDKVSNEESSDLSAAVEAIREASESDLKAVDGVGSATAKKLKAAL